MAKILKADLREFEENPGKIDNYRILSDVTREKTGINPRYLNFDIRQLDPGQYSAPYHSHRYAEELFMLISGSATLRSPEGLEVVGTGDMIFCETGEAGAHQLYNHTAEPCIFLDVRTYIGYDVCDYPDSDKILIAPSFETFGKGTGLDYFAGEENIREVWAHLERKQKAKKSPGKGSKRDAGTDPEKDSEKRSKESEKGRFATAGKRHGENTGKEIRKKPVKTAAKKPKKNSERAE